MTLACDLRAIRELIEQFPLGRDWLIHGERQRLNGFTSESRRAAYLAGRWLCRQLLSEQLGGSPGSYFPDISEQGITFVQAMPGLGVSIAHSGDWVSCVLAEGAIGLDLEILRPRPRLLAIAATVFDAEACAMLDALSGDAQTFLFYEQWTLREAWLKRQGRGLDFADMRAIRFWDASEQPAQAISLIDPTRGLVIAIDGPELDSSAWPKGLVVQRRLRYG